MRNDGVKPIRSHSGTGHAFGGYFMRSTQFFLVCCASVSLALCGSAALAQGARNGPVLSEAALDSYYAKIKGVAPELQDMRADALAEGGSVGGSNRQQVNADYNHRPQDEPSIGILKGTSGRDARWVVGANDYGIGTPVGGGEYNSEGVNSFPPFPLLAIDDAAGTVIGDPPGGTGDPAIASGSTKDGRTVTYYASLAFSASFCNNGVQVARSFDNGFSWNRTRIPAFGASGFVTYWSNSFDCSVFNDKEYIAVDNTGGPHDGRVYVTWTQFLNDATGNYQESAIYLAYSDNYASSFSAPIRISGRSASLCPNHSNAASGPTECNEDQFSSPQVLPNGDVAVSFENGNGTGFLKARGQMLLTVWSATSGAVVGPYQIAPMVFDGFPDYPFTTDGSRQTFCNSNFRNGANGNLATDGLGNLYFAYFDDKKHAGEFTGPIKVGAASTGFACPAGKVTDTDIYVLTSRDGGVTWSDITPPSGHAAHDQFWPWVAANGDHVAVVFNDRSGDPNNKLVATSLAKKRNHDDWDTRVISDFSSNFDNAFFGAGTFAGDYINLALDSAGKAHAVWTCVAPGKFDSDICGNQHRGDE